MSFLENARLTASPSGHPSSRSMRTICCFAEWIPPARMRVLTGVRYPRVRTMAPAMDAGRQAGHQPAALRIVSNDAGKRGASAERGDVVTRRCPRRPATISVVSYFRIRTGASRETLAILSVDELVGNEIPDHEHAAARESVDQRRAAAPGAPPRRATGERSGRSTC